jgi:hypothetical protein
LKRGLKSQELLFKKVNAEQAAATRASFCVARSIAKHGKPFTDGELIKDCMIAAAEEMCMSVIVFLNWSLNRNVRLLFCMIYLHCKFYNVIKINYGGPDTGHVRPAVVLAGRCWPAGRSLETPRSKA